MATSDTLAAVVSTVCTRPLPASTPMCALKPKCQFFPFLDWWASGSRECPSFLVELGASMKVASTMEPPRIMTPAASSSEFSSSSMALPRPFLSRMWRNFASI
jgi:hypothetical protein